MTHDDKYENYTNPVVVEIQQFRLTGVGFCINLGLVFSVCKLEALAKY